MRFQKASLTGYGALRLSEHRERQLGAGSRQHAHAQDHYHQSRGIGPKIIVAEITQALPSHIVGTLKSGGSMRWANKTEAEGENRCWLLAGSARWMVSVF